MSSGLATNTNKSSKFKSKCLKLPSSHSPLPPTLSSSSNPPSAPSSKQQSSHILVKGKLILNTLSNDPSSSTDTHMASESRAQPAKVPNNPKPLQKLTLAPSPTPQTNKDKNKTKDVFNDESKIQSSNSTTSLSDETSVLPYIEDLISKFLNSFNNESNPELDLSLMSSQQIQTVFNAYQETFKEKNELIAILRKAGNRLLTQSQVYLIEKKKLENKIKKKAETNTLLETEVQELKSELSECQLNLDNLINELRLVKEEITKRKKEEIEYHDFQCKLQATLTGYASECGKLRDECVKLKAQNEKVKQQLETSQTSLAHAKQTLVNTQAAQAQLAAAAATLATKQSEQAKPRITTHVPTTAGPSLENKSVPAAASSNESEPNSESSIPNNKKEQHKLESESVFFRPEQKTQQLDKLSNSNFKEKNEKKMLVMDKMLYTKQIESDISSNPFPASSNSAPSNPSLKKNPLINHNIVQPDFKEPKKPTSQVFEVSIHASLTDPQVDERKMVVVKEGDTDDEFIPSFDAVVNDSRVEGADAERDSDSRLSFSSTSANDGGSSRSSSPFSHRKTYNEVARDYLKCLELKDYAGFCSNVAHFVEFQQAQHVNDWNALAIGGLWLIAIAGDCHNHAHVKNVIDALHDVRDQHDW
ncbi:hypothetical protein HMI54_000914, partial [Coelomomyces lativittatus]